MNCEKSNTTNRQAQTAQYDILKLTEQPKLLESAAVWFHEKWGVPLEAYRESMQDSLSTKTGVPSWYLVMKDGKFIAGMGVIENDFHKRPDLRPNVCAVYTEKEYRGQGIAGELLHFVCDDMKQKGMDTLYLATNHVGFYERYGWEFFCTVECDEGEESRMYIHSSKA